MKSIVFVLLVTISSTTTATPIYMYVDADGVRHYTTTPTPHAQLLVPKKKKDSSSSLQQRDRLKKSAGSTPTTNSIFVDSVPQHLRDNERRKILQQELRDEEKALLKAEQLLNNVINVSGVAEHLPYLKDLISVHKKNIAALKSELANAR